jgi:hypothetical protein
VGIADVANVMLRERKTRLSVEKSSILPTAVTYGFTATWRMACVYWAQPVNVMKKITFILSLVSLSLTVTSASAKVQNEETDPVILPEFRIVSERYTEGEKSIRQNLAALAASAKRPAMRISTELPALSRVVHANQSHRDHATAAKSAARSQVRS